MAYTALEKGDCYLDETVSCRMVGARNTTSEMTVEGAADPMPIGRHGKLPDRAASEVEVCDDCEVCLMDVKPWTAEVAQVVATKASKVLDENFILKLDLVCRK